MRLSAIGLIVMLTLALGFLVAPLCSNAQQPGKVYHIGYLSALFPPAEPDWQQRSPFLQGMRELGWIEGQNLVIERRWAARQFERLPALATELVQLKVDLIVAEASLEIAAVKKATTPIPVVMLTPFDAVETGLVASLAHPGANVTGMTSMTLDFDPKRLELLKETVPGSARIAVLWCKAGPGSDFLVWTGRRTWEGLQVTARTLGVHLQRLEAGEPGQCGKRLRQVIARRGSLQCYRKFSANNAWSPKLMRSRTTQKGRLSVHHI
jgi:putative tryptophan/tyrosine transport system substrate-binding protein